MDQTHILPNFLGGTVILDMLSPEEIKAKVFNHLKTLNY